MTVVETAAKPSLPLFGERPYWIAPLRHMSARLELGSWDAGGCFAFANAMAKVFSGERWGLCSFVADLDHEDVGDYPVEHALTKIGGVFYDFRGAWQDPFKSIQSSRELFLKSADEPNVFWFDDEFVGDDDMEELEVVLRTGSLPRTKSRKVSRT